MKIHIKNIYCEANSWKFVCKMDRQHKNVVTMKKSYASFSNNSKTPMHAAILPFLKKN